MLVTQSCLTLCNLMDCSPPGSSVHGILQAKILEWVAIPFSTEFPDPGIKPRSPTLQADSLLSEPPGKLTCSLLLLLILLSRFSCVQLLATPWTAAPQAPLSMGFSRQEYWSGVPLPSPHFSYRQGQIPLLKNLSANLGFYIIIHTDFFFFLLK